MLSRETAEDWQDGTNWYVYADNNPLRLVDPTGLSSEETTYTTEVGERFIRNITTSKLVTVESPSENSRFTIYNIRTHEIETIKILDTPEGKEYANKKNKSEASQRFLISALIEGLGFLTNSIWVKAAGVADFGFSLCEVATSSGAAKYEAGGSMLQFRT